MGDPGVVGRTKFECQMEDLVGKPGDRKTQW